MSGLRAELEWRAGKIPVSKQFDDPYFSLEDGLAETRHVFLHGNGLPVRFHDGFHVAELGFGTGLNMLAAAQLWTQTGAAGHLHLTSFEAYPMTHREMERALHPYAELDSEPLLDAWRDGNIDVALSDRVTLKVVIGDARRTLPEWAGLADAWFLDGFSPAKNPELWEPALMMEVARHTAPGGTVATYTAAGAVRRALAEAGFAVDRTKGYGRKRHMTRGVLA